MLVIGFRVRGLARFLSHAETMRVLERACVRAGIDLEYTAGFNPRPRMSLPLPRPVGVEADDELLCLRVRWGEAASGVAEDASRLQYGRRIHAELSRQLPDGFDVLSVEWTEARSSFQARGATYVIAIDERRIEAMREKLAERIRFIVDSESLSVERVVSDKGTARVLDVRPFLKSVELNDKGVVVECKIEPAGTVRVDEILKLLEIGPDNLGGPVRRVDVDWQPRRGQSMGARPEAI